jgi:putative hydrolase of the HAD superfamily
MIRVVFLDLDETLVAQEEAFTAASRAAAELAAAVAGVDPDSFAQAIPVAAAARFEVTPMAAFVRRCRFGGRDVLWGDPSGASEPLRDLTARAPAYRRDVWATLLAQHSVSDPQLCGRLDAHFRHAMETQLAVFPEVAQVLGELGARYRLAVITNGMPAAQTEKLRRLGFGRHFQAVVASAEVGVGKPAGAIFRHALARMGASACEAVMVGDSLEGDVAGARRAGLSACWLRRSGSAPAVAAAGVPALPDLTGLKALLESPAPSGQPGFDVKPASATG